MAATRRARKYRGKKRRAALKRGVAVVESFSLGEIAVRDKYRCGLCHGKVAMSKVAPHPKSPSVDHVVPLSCGGDHTRANVQLAHFLCNSRKGVTAMGEQLALIG